jgi:hypothetical protein
MDERLVRIETSSLSEAEVRVLLQAARRRGQPGWVWPDVEPAAWRAGLSTLVGTLRTALAGSDPIRLEFEPEADPRGLAIAAFTSGLGPLLGRWVEEGRLQCAPLAGLFALHLRHGRSRWARLERIATEAVAVLGDLGLRPIVLKGLHTAATIFPEPGARLCNDVDLAVPRSRWADARAALERAGYTLVVDQQGIGRAELLPPGESGSLGSLHLLHENAPIRVDLHGGLDRAYFGAGRLALGDGTTDETEPWPALGPSARVLTEPLLTILLAAHASEGLHNLTLLRMVELSLAIRAGERSGGLDWDALVARTRRAGSLRFLFPALEVTDRLAPGTVPERVRHVLRTEAPLAMRAVVDALQPATTQRIERLSLSERLMWAGSPSELAGRLADMVWPASAGGAAGRVGRIYAERLWRLARGRVTIEG